MELEQLGEKLRPKFESALLINDKSKMKVLVAINSDENKKMVLEDIGKITGLAYNEVEQTVDFFEKADYISTFLEEISGRSVHKVCVLKESAIRVLKELGI